MPAQPITRRRVEACEGDDAMTDPTKLTPEELKQVAAEEEHGGVVDQQSANEAATED